MARGGFDFDEILSPLPSDRSLESLFQRSSVSPYGSPPCLHFVIFNRERGKRDENNANYDICLPGRSGESLGLALAASAGDLDLEFICANLTTPG